MFHRSDSSAGTNRLVVSTPNLDVAASLVRQSLSSAPSFTASAPLSTGTATGPGGKAHATRITVVVSTVVVVAVAVAAVVFRAYF